FGPLCGLAHHEHRLAERGRLFLHATAVAEHECRHAEQPGEMRVVERLDESHIVKPSELGVHDLPHVRVEVDGKDHGDVRSPSQAPNGLCDRLHAVAETLATMTRNTNDALARKTFFQLDEATGEQRFLA